MERDGLLTAVEEYVLFEWWVVGCCMEAGEKDMGDKNMAGSGVCCGGDGHIYVIVDKGLLRWRLDLRKMVEQHGRTNM